MYHLSTRTHCHYTHDNMHFGVLVNGNNIPEEKSSGIDPTPSLINKDKYAMMTELTAYTSSLPCCPRKKTLLGISSDYLVISFHLMTKTTINHPKTINTLLPPALISFVMSLLDRKYCISDHNSSCWDTSFGCLISSAN